ncbi:MAG: hypothetical protein SV201_09655 [Pseudomonadota bacterium]|nr:hypothetical protein [Pseudomonadota bacterium]
MNEYLDNDEIYKNFIEIGKKQRDFVVNQKFSSRLYIFYRELRFPVMWSLTIIMGVISFFFLTNMLPEAYASIEITIDVDPRTLPNFVVLIFMIAILVFLVLAVFRSAHILLVSKNATRQQMENAKFFVGYAFGFLTSFLIPLISQLTD